MRRLLLPLACAMLVTGCGNDRQTTPGVTSVAFPFGSRPAEFDRAGVAFAAPVNWLLRGRTAPAVFTLQSGGAFVTGFAYRRDEDLPESGAELAEAERRLISEVEDRDPDFELESSRTRTVDGAPALELRGTQTISSRALETRSVHVYKGDVEYVFEALAPAEAFEIVSQGVLRQVLRSAELSGRLPRESED